MSKLTAIAAAVAVVPALAFSNTAFAAGMGQIEGGDIYRVRNVTKNNDFVNTINATCGETVQFKVRIHNPGPSKIDNVKVVATLPNAAGTTFESRVTVSAPNADPLSTSDTAKVVTDKTATMSYVNGSTELLAAHNGTKIRTLGDTITTTGVTIPEGVGVSVDEKRFVQFSAKVNCDTPKDNDIKVCELATKNIVTIKESQFDASKHSTDLSKCKETPVTPETPTELTKTGAGDVAGLIAVVAVATAAGYSWFLRRQNAR